MWEVEPRERQRHMIIELDYPLLETNEAILFSKLTIDQKKALKWEPHDKLDNPLLETNEAILFLKLTIGVCGSKQEKALKWEPHDKVVADTDDHHIVIEAPPTNGIPTSRVMCELEPRERQSHMIIELDYPLLETNEAILFLKLTIDVCGSKLDYPLLETNETILFLKLTIGVCGSKQEEALKWEPHDKLDYPLLETNETILFLKLTIGVCGSK
nr:hypothetical protein [Tanacetum cinerariifolium]